MLFPLSPGVMGLVGQNEAGKSTLQKILAAVLPTKGGLAAYRSSLDRPAASFQRMHGS